MNETAKNLNKDLENIKKWVPQWNMFFSPDLTKMAKEVLVSKKKLKVIHSNLRFLGRGVKRHLCLVLDSKLNFDMDLREKISVANNGIALLTLCTL